MKNILVSDPRRCITMGAILLGMCMLSGCWAAAAYERSQGKSVTAQYTGLQNHSVAIIVYASEDAILFEYPTAREDVAAFVTQQLRTNIPSIRLVDYHEVADWQNQTPHWEVMQVKDMGRHFSVDRVIYIELSDYSMHDPGSDDLLRGHLKASAKVFETTTPGDTPAWQGDIEAYFPMDGPADVNQTDEPTVRKRTLALFSKNLVDCFYDHRQRDPTIRERSGEE